MSKRTYTRAIAITKHDTDNIRVDLPDRLTDALYVGGAGIAACVFQDGTVVNITFVAGGMLPLRIKRVNSTNTTATVMTALYKE